MNIEKERELFEAWASKETEWDLHWSMNINQYMDHQTNGSWLAWLAAKQQAIPEGYRLTKIPIAVGNNNVDWSKAPTWANFWLKDGRSNKFWWSSNRPSIDRDLNTFVWRGNCKAEEAPSFGFTGDWSKSMTSRKSVIQEAQK